MRYNYYMSEKKTKPSKKREETKVDEKIEKIPFSVWFHGQVRSGNLKFWQTNEISVFFKAKGLSENEEADKYSEVLKLY